MTFYWPWWAGALGLAALGIGYRLALGKPLGVSGHWERVMAPLCGRPGATGGARDGASFLVGILLGGVVAAATGGGWEVRGTLGALYTAYYGNGAAGWAVLFVGGMMVGYGTRLADGCTSGHGLVGCSSFQRGSFAATAVFFAAASATAFALSAALR